MKKINILLMFLAVAMAASAQVYFPQGTKWTEVRLDTLMYDSWYSMVDGEWVANFETINYVVEGEFYDIWYDPKVNEYQGKYVCVYTDGPTWTDSLTLLVNEEVTEYAHVIGALTPNLTDERCEYSLPGQVMDMNWSVGKTLYYQDIYYVNWTGFPSVRYAYGTIDEIKEGTFGTENTLQYVDLNGLLIIHGIGLTEWKDGECLFGPIEPYEYAHWPDGNLDERHYRSMLVHFERDGEVLYDVWPQKDFNNGMTPVRHRQAAENDAVYDLQGRRLDRVPKKGLYIRDGREVVVK